MLQEGYEIEPFASEMDFPKRRSLLGALEDGYERNFIPDMKQVLFATPLVSSSKTFQLDFIAPDQPGNYPFILFFSRTLENDERDYESDRIGARAYGPLAITYFIGKI